MVQHRQIMMVCCFASRKKAGFGINLISQSCLVLVDKFSSRQYRFIQSINRYVYSTTRVKTSDDLYRILQHPGETTRVILTRFTREMVSIGNCDEYIAMQATRKCLLPGSELYRKLTCTKLKLRLKFKHMFGLRSGEKKMMQSTKQNLLSVKDNTSTDRHSHKPKGINWRSKPYFTGG